MDTPRILERNRAVCPFCRSDVDTSAAGTHQWVAGWVKNREGGGGHGISLPERSSRWAHPWCVESAVKGFTKQTTMF